MTYKCSLVRSSVTCTWHVECVACNQLKLCRCPPNNTMIANSTVIASRMFRLQRYVVIFIVSALVVLLFITSIAARSQTELLRDKLSDYLQTLKQGILGTIPLNQDDKDDTGIPAPGLIPDDEPVIPKLNSGDDGSLTSLEKEVDSKPKGGAKEDGKGLKAESTSDDEKDAKGKQNGASENDNKVDNKEDEPVKGGGDSTEGDFKIGLSEIERKAEEGNDAS